MFLQFIASSSVKEGEKGSAKVATSIKGKLKLKHHIAAEKLRNTECKTHVMDNMGDIRDFFIVVEMTFKEKKISK